MTTSVNDFVALANTLENRRAAEEAKAAARSGNFLLAMALILGAIADNMSVRVVDAAIKLDKEQNRVANLPTGADRNSSENQLNAQMQATLQLFNQFMSALTNAIKTYGEANANLARKN